MVIALTIILIISIITNIVLTTLLILEKRENAENKKRIRKLGRRHIIAGH